MKIPRPVKPLPFPLHYMFKGLAFNNCILLRKSIIEDLRKNKPDPQSVGVLLHELEHQKRIKKCGKLKFSFNYWLFSKFRFREELAANLAQMKYLKSKNCDFDIQKRARQLSGPIYLWCINYEKAKSELKDLWRKL